MLTLDVSQPDFYYPYIIIFSLIFGTVQILTWVFGKKEKHEHMSIEDKELMNSEEFIQKGKDLKLKYMSAFLLSKASMWAKAPYTYMLFSTIHGFTVGQIGILYLIDAISSLFAGPFIGILADTFGRKVIALYYPINTIIILLMRMSGNIPLAYAAQVMTGIAGNVLATSFEAWLNFEILKIYGSQKTYIEYFRKNMFSKILFYDSILSIVVTSVGALLYNMFGILCALSLSIFLAALSVCVIITMWPENKPNSEHTTDLVDSFKEGMKLLKHPQIFFLGLMDSFYNCAIQILVFVWTPVLQETAHTRDINPAMIYMIMILTILIHNKVLDFFHKSLKIDYFVLSAFYLFIFLTNWFVIYFADSFRTRLICLAMINGSGGLFNPVLSYLRSLILVERYRALLMNLFRVPLNMILIVMLILSNYFNPLQICFIVGIVLIIPFLSSIYLLYYDYTVVKKIQLKKKQEEEDSQMTDA